MTGALKLRRNNNLKGKVAIVTGASRGIGKAIAIALAEAGAAVTVAARTTEEGQSLRGTILKAAAEISAHGGRALAVKTDVGDEAEVEAMVTRTLQDMGRIDILVNNAGAAVPRIFQQLTLKQWDLVYRICLRGPVACTMAVLPAMMKQKYGHIINVSSVAATTVNEPFTGLAYDASKAGINRLTWGLSRELKEHHIAVNALSPQNTASEGWVYLHPDADISQWQTPVLWGKIATFVAAQDPVAFTGRILTRDSIKQEMTVAGWNVLDI